MTEQKAPERITINGLGCYANADNPTDTSKTDSGEYTRTNLSQAHADSIVQSMIQKGGNDD